MRGFMLFYVAFAAGCGASQAAPAVATAPAASMVATQPVVQAAVANAATGQIGAGWTVTITGATGGLAPLAGRTFTVPRISDNGLTISGAFISPDAHVSVLVVPNSRSMSGQPTPTQNMSVLGVGIPTKAGGSIIAAPAMSFSGTGQVIEANGTISGSFSANVASFP